MPGFEPLQHFISLCKVRPDGFALLQANFVGAFANTILFATIVRRGRNPHHAIQRHMLVINPAKNRHFFIRSPQSVDLPSSMERAAAAWTAELTASWNLRSLR